MVWQHRLLCFKEKMIKLRTYLLIFFAYLLAPFFFFAIRKKNKFNKKNNLRILVIPHLTRIGDLVCATPVFRKIKEKYPKSHLSVLISRISMGIIKNNPHLDKILIYEEEEYRNFFGPLKLIKKIKQENFLWSFCLPPMTFGSILAFYSLIPNRAKIVRRKRPLTEFLTDWLNNFKLQYQEGENILRLYLKILKFIDIAVPEKIIKEVFTSESGDIKTKEFFKKHAIMEKDFVVGISVTTGSEIKEWGLERFAELSKRLIENYKAKIIFIGSLKDEKKINKVNGLIGNNGIVATDFSLEELPSLMKRFNVFIAADSGPVHIAHALGIPLIDIIGPVDPDEQAPNDEKSIIITPPSDIKPTIFAIRPAGDPKQSRRAAESISVENVLDAFKLFY